MKEYTVYIKEVHVTPVPVQADSEERAREIVQDWLENDDVNIPFDALEYYCTLDASEWSVFENAKG